MEKLAQKIEQLENLVSSLVNMTTLSADIHVESLRENLPIVLKGLKEGYLEIGGEQFWFDEEE